MIDREIDSPIPKPIRLVVWKGSKMRGAASAGSPSPESRTRDQHISLGWRGPDQQFSRPLGKDGAVQLGLWRRYARP